MDSSVVSVFLPTHHSAPGSPRDICVNSASLTDLRTAQLLGGYSDAGTQMLQPGLEALLVFLSPKSAFLPPLLFSVSHTPKLPSTQVLASPVPLQSHVCSSHALLDTFLSLPTLLPMNRGYPASPLYLFWGLFQLSSPTVLLPSETYVHVSLALLSLP